MSGTDQIVYNTRERAVSADYNDLQSLKDRTLLESFLEAFQLRTYALGAQPTEAADPIVLGGLEIAPSGTDIGVSPGILLQDSASLAPTPGPLDSTYRWARNASTTTISNPAPGADTYYLVEAQMTEVVALSTTRDIFDTGTGLFVPTLVTKRTERQISFQLVAGTTTNFPLPTGGDWVVIGGVLVPTGGGAIPAANFVDMRPLWTDLGPAVLPAAEQGRRRCRVQSISGIGSPNNLLVACEAWAGGRRLWFDTSLVTGIDPVTDIAIWGDTSGTSPTLANTSSTLYLAPLVHTSGTRPLFVRNAYRSAGITDVNGNCLLIWSTQLPSTTTRVENSTTLNPPAPWANYTIPIGSAVSVGSLVTGAASTLTLVDTEGDNRMIFRQSPASGVWQTSIAITGSGTFDFVNLFAFAARPSTAKSYEVLFTHVGTGSGSSIVLARDSGSTTSWAFDLDMTNAASFRATFLITSVPEVAYTTATPPATLRAEIVGWNM